MPETWEVGKLVVSNLDYSNIMDTNDYAVINIYPKEEYRINQGYDVFESSIIAFIDWELIDKNIVNPKDKITLTFVDQTFADEIDIQENLNYWTTDLFKIKPSRVYYWDLVNETFELSQADRTEKKSDDEGGYNTNSNGKYEACDPKDFYLIKSINGNALPWTEYDDGSNSLTWDSGSLAINNDGTWSNRITSKQIISGGATKDVNTNRNGTWTCSNEYNTISFNNSGGNGGTATVNEDNGEITLPDGSYTIVYY